AGRAELALQRPASRDLLPPRGALSVPKPPPPKPDDLTLTLDLLRRAQQGERPALERLLERYYERVRRIVRLRLGPSLRRRLESGDILQETFLAAVRNFARFELRDEGSFINWLAVLAENQIRDAADHHGAQKRAMLRQV